MDVSLHKTYFLYTTYILYYMYTCIYEYILNNFIQLLKKLLILKLVIFFVKNSLAMTNYERIK